MTGILFNSQTAGRIFFFSSKRQMKASDDVVGWFSKPVGSIISFQELGSSDDPNRLQRNIKEVLIRF